MNKKEKELKSKKRPIRIAVVMGKYTTGGIKSVIMNYYQYIDRNEIQFDFIVDEDSPLQDFSEIYEYGGKVYKVTPVKYPIRNICEIYNILKKGRYLCVHGYINTLNVFPMFAGYIAGTPVRIAENLSTAHRGEKKTIIKNMLKPFSLVFPTHIAANSQYAAEWLYGRKNINKCQIIRNALDLTHYRYDIELRNATRKKMDIDDKFVVGHIGRYEYQKNHDFLIDIFLSIYKKEPNARLLLVGYGTLKEKIWKKIELLGLKEVVIDCQATENISPLYNAMDCFVLPSLYEGLPVVGIEAQATGVPCVISTEVTKETQVTSNVDFVDLSESADIWADYILKWKNYRRNNAKRMVTDNGYNIEKEAETLKNYYMKCLFEKIGV